MLGITLGGVVWNLIYFHDEKQVRTYSLFDENMFGLVQFWVTVSVR